MLFTDLDPHWESIFKMTTGEIVDGFKLPLSIIIDIATAELPTDEQLYYAEKINNNIVLNLRITEINELIRDNNFTTKSQVKDFVARKYFLTT